jgi:hypothetical protein
MTGMALRQTDNSAAFAEASVEKGNGNGENGGSSI